MNPELQVLNVLIRKDLKQKLMIGAIENEIKQADYLMLILDEHFKLQGK